ERPSCSELVEFFLVTEQLYQFRLRLRGVGTDLPKGKQCAVSDTFVIAIERFHKHVRSRTGVGADRGQGNLNIHAEWRVGILGSLNQWFDGGTRLRSQACENSRGHFPQFGIL